MTAHPRLNLATLWDALAPDVQRQFGVAALAVGYSLARPRAEYIACLSACEEAGSRALEGLGHEHLGGREAPGGYGILDLTAAFGIAQCHVCGCTDEFACDVGCGWHSEGLCSACASEQEQVP